MFNREPAAAWRYHDATKHSYESIRTDPHSLDWANQPVLEKRYTDLEPIPLPTELPSSGVRALDAVAALTDAHRTQVPTLRELGYLLYLSAGITKRRRYGSTEITFRAASCTGALYEIELYVVCGPLADLDAGVYHFNPVDFALRALRSGDYRDVLVHASGRDDRIVNAPFSIVCTGTYWRNAWKYRARTYRHFGWDNGTTLANLLAASRALGFRTRTLVGFDDEAVNTLLGVDAAREVSFSIVAIGAGAGPPPRAPEVGQTAFATEPPSGREVDYPLMREMHAASSLHTAVEVIAWREGATPLASDLTGRRTSRRPMSPPGVAALRALDSSATVPDLLEDVIQRRGSTRQFDRHASWTLGELATTLTFATRGLDADFLGSEPGEGIPALNDVYVVVHAVDDLAPGAYVLHREPWQLELLKKGRFRQEAGYLGLEQDLPADACAVVFFLADLRTILDRLGNRGYRAVQLEAGIVGGRMYLASYAQHLGASGLTFYDDDVVEFFAPHAEGKSAIFCMTLGTSVRASRTVSVQR